MFSALCAAVGSQALESANVVGYTTKTVEAGKFYLIAVQFNDASSSTKGSIDMNSLIKLSPEITAGTYAASFAGASEIQVLNAAATGYDMYYYISDATDTNDDPVGYNCWSDMDGYILEGNQVEAGASFWIKGNAAGTMGFTK